MTRPILRNSILLAVLLYAFTTLMSAQKLTTLYSFAGSDGAQPYAGLVQGSDGNFYGTTEFGGVDGPDVGTVFKITPSGTLTTYSFDFIDGWHPLAALVQGRDGNFYGTTVDGGQYELGNVFKITPSGNLTTLYSFAGGDGAQPGAALVQGSDGNFYGTAIDGGGYGVGTAFKIPPSGTLTTLYTFVGANGALPDAALVQGSDGNFYGTTSSGGANDAGTVFRLDVVHPCATCRP